MANTNSLVTAVNETYFNNFMADDGTTHRVRDGQTFIGTAFGNLAVPAGATIDGIEVIMEGYAGVSDHDAQVGDWIYVSNDGGSSFSTAQSVTTGVWSINSGVHAIEVAGGASELWGKSWDANSANDIQVKMTWSTTGGDAVYLDYVKVIVYYTEDQPDPPALKMTSGILQLKSGKVKIG